MAYYDGVIKADAPVAWWPLTDAAGAGTLVDSSGGGHAATNHGLTLGETQSPIAGDTTAFNGGTTYAVSTYLPNGLTAANVEAWIYATSSPAIQYAVSSGVNTTDAGIGLYFQNATALCRIGNGTTLGNPSHANALVDNVWQYWCYTWDGAHVLSYLNGSQLGTSVALTGTIPAAGSTYLVTQSTTTNTFQGYVAQPAIYNKALTAAQVTAHYQAAINPPPSGAYASGVGLSPYWARGAAENHFAHRARMAGSLGRRPW